MEWGNLEEEMAAWEIVVEELKDAEMTAAAEEEE